MIIDKKALLQELTKYKNCMLKYKEFETNFDLTKNGHLHKFIKIIKQANQIDYNINIEEAKIVILITNDNDYFKFIDIQTEDEKPDEMMVYLHVKSKMSKKLLNFFE